MKKIISILAVFFLTLIIFTSCGDCKGHENFIRNGQIKQARKTGCKITEISVTYLGDCKYEVISETYDPFAEYGYGATIYSDCIYQWKNGDYIFVSEDKTKSEKDINVENNEGNNTTKQKKDLSETKVYQKVDVMPSFPGGDESLMKFFKENIRYPQSAKESGINGKVFITFIIDENGKVTEVKVLRGIGGGCDEEAVRVARLMPQWNPGKQNGKAVRVEYNMPIKFQL